MAASKTRTRGKESVKKAAEAVAATSSTAPKVSLNPESTNPPKVFILPRDTSSDARIVNLINPKTTLSTRYLCCPEKGFYEFKKIAEPRTSPRSWLLVPPGDGAVERKRDNEKALVEIDNREYVASQGYVMRHADMFIATPIDPLFLVLPVLAPPTLSQGSEPTKRLFLAIDDYLDSMISTSAHFRTLLRRASTQKRIENRMAAICDSVEAGDDTMYRLNETKLVHELLHKAKKVAERGLPSSMEEVFVKTPLETPMLNLKREESPFLEDGGGGAPLAISVVATPATDSMESYTSTNSTDILITSISNTSTAVSSTSGVDEAVKPANPAPATTPSSTSSHNHHLLRIRTALNFIISSYLPPHLQRTVQAHLHNPSLDTIDFTALDQRLSELANLREQALMSRSLGDHSRKRAWDEDEETRADKKRRKEEEDKKRKAGESRGVKELKKVNVKGMKKMSDFFAKKT